MSTLENNKLLTQTFIENARSDDKIEDVQEEPTNESEKLILDEIATEKSEANETTTDNQSGDEKEVVAETQVEHNEETMGNLKTEVQEENLSEDTESSRDQKSLERDTSDEEEEQMKEAPKEEWQNILGSGVIMKKVLKEGESDSRPTSSNKCLINYTCRLEEADEEDFVEKADNYELALGEGDVVQGLDVAIGLMNKKERCLLKIGSRLAYGERGLPPNIPSNATVMFDVELVDVQREEDFDSLSVQNRRKMGNKKRERGNWWYLRGENTLAVQCYRRALDYLDEVESESTEHDKPSDSELQQLLEDRLKVLNNMASAQIKMELYDQALTSLQAVLRCQPDNVKALFRKAKIHSAKNDLPQALKLLEKAKALEPDDALITKEINAVNNLISKQKNSEREYARRMFGGSSPTTSTSKTKVEAGSKKSSSKNLQVWATLGASMLVGIAGMILYKIRYPS